MTPPRDQGSDWHRFGDDAARQAEQARRAAEQAEQARQAAEQAEQARRAAEQGRRPARPGEPRSRNPLAPGSLPRDPRTPLQHHADQGAAGSDRPGATPPAMGRAWGEVDPPVAPPGPPRVPRRAGSSPAVPAHRPGRTHGSRPGGGILAGRILVTMLSVVVLVGWGFYALLFQGANNDIADSDALSSAQQAAGAASNGGAQNILLIGSDARTDADGNPLSADQLSLVSTTADGGGVNTDTLMLIHVPADGSRATAVSIPRDTWIGSDLVAGVKGPYADGTSGPYKPNKINSFYGAAKFYTEQALAAQGVAESPAREKQSNEAGRTMLIGIVSAFTGLHIDHFAEVNLIGFYTLSEALQGVPVCLNAAVNDPYSGANFAAGPQTVQGTQAMAFVRQRHGLPGGDLDRVRRQQAFLSGALQKVLSAGTLTSPSKLSALVDAAKTSLTLDSGFNLLSFADQMSSLSGGNVTFTTIPTHGSEASADSDALATDPAEIKAFFAGINGTTAGTGAATSAPATSTADSVDPSTVTVDVHDATASHVAGTPVMDTLAGAGFTRGQNDDVDGITKSSQHGTTIIGYHSGEQAAAEAVKSALGFGQLQEDSSVSAGHVTVTVGTDSTESGLHGALGALQAGDTSDDGPADTTAASGQPITAGGVPCVN